MISRPVRLRSKAFTVSVALHVAVLGAVAGIRVGMDAPPDSAPETGRPVTFTWAAKPAEAVLDAPPPSCTIVSRRVPAARVEFVDASALDEPLVTATAATPPAAPGAPSPPTAEQWMLMRASAHAGRGGAGVCTNGPGAGGGGLGVGTGSGGGPGGNGSGDGSSYGAGHGAGSDGDGTGYAAMGGATRGPAVSGTLTPPEYPSRARSRGWEGCVVLVLSIDADGHVVKAEISESSGRSSLDEAAVDASRAWSFAPALRDGEPVAGMLRVPVRFELTD